VLSLAPWVFGGSPLTKYIIVSNHFHAQVLEQFGVPKEKVLIFGDINYDKLYDTNQRKKLLQRKFKKENKIVLLSLPQLVEHHYLPEKEAKLEFDFYIQTILQLDVSLYISLHPMMPYEKYKYLEEKYACTIIKQPLNTFLPLSDLYICGSSNTVLWALLSKVNSVVFDFYQWDYELLNQFQCFSFVNNKSNLLPQIKKSLASSSNCFEQNNEMLSVTSVFDGNVTKRYIELIEKTHNNTNSLPIVSKFWSLLSQNKIKQIEKFLNKTKHFYLAPNNDLTQNLNKLLSHHLDITFLGFLDQNKQDDDTFSPRKLPVQHSDTSVIIFSPNHYQSIKKTLLNIFDEQQIYTIKKNFLYD
jgi:hypothetical protein